VKENYYKNKINKNQNNTSDTTSIQDTNSQIKDQILVNYKFNAFYEKLSKNNNQNDITAILSRLSDNLYVTIDKLNTKID
jgi:hypothetical protein